MTHKQKVKFLRERYPNEWSDAYDDAMDAMDTSASGESRMPLLLYRIAVERRAVSILSHLLPEED